MADSVKNVTFRFKADTSQLQRVIDDLNKSIANAQKTLSNIKLSVNNAEAKAAINALGGEYRKLIGADNEYKKQAIAAAKQIKKENEAAAKEITRQKQSEYKKLIAADNDYIRQARANAQKLRQEQAQLSRQASQEAARAAREQARGQARGAVVPVAGGGGTGFMDTLKGGLAAFGIVATADALVDLGKSTVQAAIDFERLTASFRALIGDKERADQAIRDIQQFALETPFDVTQIAAAGKTLLGYGISVEDLIPTLKQLGDVSAASGGDIQRVALAFGQVAAKGKLQGEEIRQLVNVGFNPLQEISKATGESMAALAKRVEEGRVTFDEVAEAFKTATEEGGRFYNLASTLNNTFGGQLQKLTEQINLFKIEVGTAAADELRPLVQELVRFFTASTDLAKTIRENVVALGILKGVLAFVVSLLFKSANAYVANALSIKTWNNLILAGQKQIVAFSLALRINTIAVGANTASQKAAVVATTLWDAASKGLTVTTGVLGTAVKSLWATIAANPIGAIIASYYILNGLLDLNKEKTEEAILQETELLNIRKLAADYANQQAGAIKATEGALRDQQKLIIESIKADGLKAASTQKLIEDLEKQEQIDLRSIKTAGDKNRALRELNEIIEKLIQKKSIEIEVRGAENQLNQLRENLGKAINQFETLLKERKLEPDFIQELLNFINPGFLIKGDVAAQRLDKLVTDRENFYIKYIYEIKENIKKAENELADAQARLLGIKIGAPAKDKDPLKKEKDALEALRKLIQGLINDIDKLNSKRIGVIIDQMPEETEQEQKLKATARFDELTRQNRKERAEERRRASETYQQALKDGADKVEARKLYGDALATIDEKYWFEQRINNLQLANDLERIGREWREKDLKGLQDYTDASIEELEKQRERLVQGRKELLDRTISDFGEAGIGQGKAYKPLIRDYSNAVVQGIRDVQSIEEKAAEIRYQREVDRINKTYKFERQAYTGSFEGLDAFVNEQNALELKVNSEKLNALRLADQKYKADLLAAQKKGDDDIDAFNKDKAAKEEAARVARIERIFGEIEEITRLSIDAAQQVIDAEIRKNEILINLQRERVDEARKIAEKGNAELLDAEEQRLNELQRKRAKFVRAQQALIFAQTVAESALAVAKAAALGGGALSPVLIASTIAALVSGFLAAKAASKNAIEGFADGGWTGKGGKYEPAGVVHREEFVVKKGPAEKFRPMLEQMNRGRDPLLAKGMGQQVIMINNVGVEERLARIEKAITGQDRMQLTIDESGIHGIVSHYQWKNQRIRNKTS